MSLFKTSIQQENGKKTVYGNGNISRKLKIKKQSEDNVMKSISNALEIKKENEDIKNRIVWNIRSLFEQEDHCYKSRVGHFWNDIYGIYI